MLTPFQEIVVSGTLCRLRASMQADLLAVGRDDRKVYGSTKFFAETVEELSAKCGEHGPAAVAEATWGAITAWLMRMHRSDVAALANPLPLAIKAAFLVSRHDRACLGYLHHNGDGYASPLDDLPDFARAGIMAAASETAADWERAGCPNLDRGRVRTVQMYLHACLRNADERAACGDTSKNGQKGDVTPTIGDRAIGVAHEPA